MIKEEVDKERKAWEANRPGSDHDPMTSTCVTCFILPWNRDSIHHGDQTRLIQDRLPSYAQVGEQSAAARNWRASTCRPSS